MRLAGQADPRIAAHASFFSGQVLLRLKRASQASHWLSKAQTLASQINDQNLLLYSRFHLAIADAMTGKIQSALSQLDRVIETASNLGERQVEIRAHLESLRLIASLLAQPTASTENLALARSIQGQTQALVIIWQADPTSFLPQAEQTLTSLSALIESGHPLAGQTALKLLAAIPQPKKYLDTRWTILRARALATTGQSESALALLPASPAMELDLLRARLEILAASGKAVQAVDEATRAMQGRPREEQARLAGFAGHISLSLGLVGQATGLVEEALRSSDKAVRAQALADGASLALAAGDHATAIRRIQESGLESESALRLLASALVAGNKVREAKSLINSKLDTTNSAALALLRAQIFSLSASNAVSQAEAGRMASKALLMAKEYGDNLRAAWSAILLARCESGTNATSRLKQAIGHAQQAGDIRAEATALHDLGLAALRDAQTHKALDYLDKAATLFDAWRLPWRGNERLYSAADWAGTRRHAALAHLILGDAQAAWSAYEDSLARELRESVLSNEERELTRLRRELDQALIEGQPGVILSAIKRQISEAKKNLPSSRAPATLDAFTRALASEGSLAASYLVWEDDKPGFLFLCQPEGLKVIQLPASSSLRSDALAFGQIAARPLIERVWSAAILGTKIEDRREEFLRRGKALRQTLLDPVLTAMSKSHLTNLVIISGGELAGLPFAALPLEDRAEGKCLGERFVLINPTSASVWLRPQPKRKHDGRVLLVGDTGQRRIADGRVFATLPGSGREMNSIASLYPDQSIILRGQDANLKKIGETLQLGPPSILHLATHGFFFIDPFDGRERGALLLAGPGQNGISLDERTIAGMALNGSLVTLSACETARGQLVAGEGMLSLMRAFLSAGARSVTASLWQIGDQATREYMELFYRFLQSGSSPPQAHRAVRVALAKAGRWPAQRAAFICSD
jgi:CHAT domain-containing protein